MTDKKYLQAGGLLFLSAALHVPVLILAFSTQGMSMIIAIVLWILLGLGLRRGMRWVAWIAFFAMIFVGMVASMAGAVSIPGVVGVLFWLIFLADLGAAILLFGILWAPKAKAVAEA